MLKKIRNLAYTHAIFSSLIIAFLFYFIMKGVSAVFNVLPDLLVVDYIEEIFCIIYPIGIVILFGFSSKLKSKNFFKGLLCGMVFIALQLTALLTYFIDKLSNDAIVWKPWYLIILGIISTIAIGVRDECFFRATIQNILAQKYAHSIKGVWFTAIISAIIFGLIHMFNVFAGVDVLSTIIQSVTNIGVGLFFAALYFRCGNIWTLIAVHALTDTSGLFSYVFCYASEAEIISAISWHSLIMGIILVGVSIFMLRPSKCKEILKRFDEFECELVLIKIVGIYKSFVKYY